MEETLTGIINESGYIGTALLIFIENLFPPIPSEVVLLFGGFMTTYADLNIWLVIFWATVGSYLGACVLYFIGHFLSKERLYGIVSGKIGKVLHIKYEHIDKAFLWFERRGSIAVLVCRCIPVVRSLISIPAGMAKMKFPLFSLLTILGSSVWNTALVFAGRFSKTAWNSLACYAELYSKIAFAAMISGAAIFYIIYKRRKKNGSETKRKIN